MNKQNSDTAYITRNKFFLQNYELFDKLSNIYARKIHRVFPSVMMCDLISYALEGMLVSLDKVDFNSSSWLSYVRRYAFLNTMNGAMIMIGRMRCRSRQSQPKYVQLCITCADHEKLIAYSDRQQLRQYNDFDTILNDILEKDQIEWFMNKLNNTIQYKILKLLIQNYSIPKIASICHLTAKKTRKIVLSLPNIFQLAAQNMDISYCLDPIRPSRRFNIRTKNVIPLRVYRQINMKTRRIAAGNRRVGEQ